MYSVHKVWILVLVVVVVSFGTTANGQRGCRILVNGMKKDHTFTYKGKNAAAFDNYEIKPVRFGSNRVPLQVIANGGSLEQCFKKCAVTKSCNSFTFSATSSCTLWENMSVAADGSKGKSIAKFCESLGSIAGYVGYNSKESAEDKAEKRNCNGDSKSYLKQCQSVGSCRTGWKATCNPAKGISCVC